MWLTFIIVLYMDQHLCCGEDSWILTFHGLQLSVPIPSLGWRSLAALLGLFLQLCWTVPL